ncbi:ABC transporter ATP-binding protein [Ramlibacter sp.]|uniref:ABC transporter ATP-binding protein n=1 Tax=Ramlibacter sp. TaxID=1917967 RepID=UPI002FCABC4D
MLDVKAVSLSFRGVRALAAVDLQVAKGELLGVIGPNGSGKSTLFNVISGIYRPDSGSLVFDGKSLIGVAPAQIVRDGLVRTFQNKRLFVNLTVHENVMVAALKAEPGSALGDVLGLRRSREALESAESRARECLRIVGLTALADVLTKDLPYGAQNRLEIARALVLDPSLLLLDEPAAGLNPSERTEVVQLIRKIHERGITIALVEHDMRIVTGLCSRIAVLDHGEKIADGPAKEVIDDPKVLEAYFGAELSAAEEANP